MTYFSILAGFTLGLALSIAACYLYKNKLLEKERLRANLKLYHELLRKKQDPNYQYSPDIRSVINRVHAALLVAQAGKNSVRNHQMGIH